MADPNPPTPTITAAEPHQATLRDEGKIIVRWTSEFHPYDQWHFIFAEDGHDFTEVEIDTGSRDPGINGFFVISPTLPGRGYNFKVQGCLRGNIIFPNDCSDFNDGRANGRIVMPQNTRSL